MGYRDEVLADSPDALWEFTETSGNLVSSNGTYTAVPSGGVLLNQAGPKGGKAVYFDGTDDFLSIAGFPDFIADGSYTFEAWVKFGNQPRDYPTFVRRDGNGKTYIVRTRGPATGSRVYELESYHSGQTVMTSPATFNDDAWHHVVMVSSGNSGTLYVDGTAYTSRNGFVSSGGTGTAAPLYLGRGSGASEYFQGYMAFVALYPTALSSTRVRAHFNAVESGPAVALRSGLANTLALGSLQGPTLALGAVVTPPVEVLAGIAQSLSLRTLEGPTIVKGAAVVPPNALQAGVAATLYLRATNGATIVLTEPVPVGTLGEWFFEVLMSQKALNADNPTASLEVTNDRKRVRTELKTLVRA